LPAGKDPVRLVMTAGRTITGRVLDKSGNPQEGVTVSINRFEQTFLAGTLKATTDSQGNFSLAHAPLGAVQMVTNKQGYTSDFEQVGADTNSFNFTIAPLLAMHGTVTDAVTGDPIPQFQVIVGAKWVNSNSPNFSMTGGSFTGGQYLQTLDGYSGNIDSWYVKIVARGYMPAVSPPLYASGAQDFKLQPAKDLIGRVLDAAGNPVVGAQVMVGGPGQQMQIQNGDLMNVGNGQTAQVTDGQGKYDVPPQIGNYMIVAVSPAGYGTADQDDLARSPDIHFTAWGRIEGTVIVDGKPGAGEQIDAYEADRTYDPQSPMLYFGMNAQSDAQGHFTFNQVPATDIIVSRLVQPDGGRTNNLTTAQSEQITVTAGQTTTVTLGGKGRPVIGQVKFPAEAATWPEHQINSNVMMKVDLPPLPIPPDMARTPQDYQTWMSKFRKTDAGKAYFRLLAKRRVYQLELDADGNFKIEDVVPGTYTVNISVFPRQGGQILAQAVTEFTVPPIPGGYTSEPLEIPTLVLKGNHPISVGDPAPGFSAATLDGKQINLFDYHGKYVLLEIWMSMFPNGTTQTQQLKAVHDAYGKDDRLVMIGLSADMLPARTADFVRKNQLDWIQCVLGPQQAQMIAMNYGVQEIPYILLIGPDGNLLAMHLKDDAIMAAVRQALGPPATQP
jgi:peroxiredoxin